jgi:hypothetical protein
VGVVRRELTLNAPQLLLLLLPLVVVYQDTLQRYSPSH